MQPKDFQSKKQPRNAQRPAPSVVGRSFILGLPDTHGSFHIGLQNQLWSIDPGDYRAGDRVQVVAVDRDRLLVQASCMGTSGIEVGEEGSH